MTDKPAQIKRLLDHHHRGSAAFAGIPITVTNGGGHLRQSQNNGSLSFNHQITSNIQLDGYQKQFGKVQIGTGSSQINTATQSGRAGSGGGGRLSQSKAIKISDNQSFLNFGQSVNGPEAHLQNRNSTLFKSHILNDLANQNMSSKAGRPQIKDGIYPSFQNQKQMYQELVNKKDMVLGKNGKIDYNVYMQKNYQMEQKERVEEALRSSNMLENEILSKFRKPDASASTQSTHNPHHIQKPANLLILESDLHKAGNVSFQRMKNISTMNQIEQRGRGAALNNQPHQKVPNIIRQIDQQRVIERQGQMKNKRVEGQIIDLDGCNQQKAGAEHRKIDIKMKVPENQIDDEDMLDLEDFSDEFDQDEKILFKDSIKDGTYGKPRSSKNKPVRPDKDFDQIQNISSDDEIEITDQHLNITDENTSSKGGEQRSTPQQPFKLKNTQYQNLFNKYFDSGNDGNIQGQKSYELEAQATERLLRSGSRGALAQAQNNKNNLKNLAKQNGFLNNKNALLKQQQSVQNSSFNQKAHQTIREQNQRERAYLNSKKTSLLANQRPDLSLQQEYQLKRPPIYNATNSNGRHDWAVYQDKVNLNKAQQQIQRKYHKAIALNEQKKKDEKEKEEKIREILRRKKAIEKKKKQDEVLDELFDYDLSKKDQKKKDKDKKDFCGEGLANLQQLDDESDEIANEGEGLDNLKNDDEEENSPQTNGELEIGLEQMQQEEQDHLNQMISDQERLMEQQRRAKEKEQQEFEQRMRLIRYKNRMNVDELIQPILNLELVNMYSNDDELDPSHFPTVPRQFESASQYFQIWLQLFLYETYNQLINQRDENEKDKELSKLYGMKMKNDNSRKNFKGMLQRHKRDQNFIYLKLLEKDNTEGKKDRLQALHSAGNQSYSSLMFPHIGCLKEFDLLLLSSKELDTTNVKKLTSSKFLKDIQQETGKLMAVVSSKRQIDKNFVEIKVDISHENYVSVNCSEFEYHEMNVYYFDSISTRTREFRTIKSAEFYPTAKYILNPSLIPKLKDEQNPQVETVPQGPNGGASTSMEFNQYKKHPVDRTSYIMKKFIENNKDVFNPSQLQALNNVSNMKPVDFLLIQGPPGTGKTHTIKGIISMLNYSFKNNRKILVCAPSNAAIDEIVTRLISKGGLMGQTEEESIKKVLRIGSFDYDPSKIVKQVTIDKKLDEGSALYGSGTQEEQEQVEQQRQRWITDIQNVEKVTKLISAAKGDAHKNSEPIKHIVEQLLANKNQIMDYMRYDKKKKLNKLQKYSDDVKHKLKVLDDQTKTSGKNLTKNQRKALEKKIIQQTQIICTTLAMSTNEKLEYLSPGDIEYLIVDEACQSVELNNLIPFEHKPAKVILVGDQQQLPATTFSENAEKTNYSRSMFERFLECGVDKVMLEIQYRMDPNIREFPSIQFYENRLQDDESIQKRMEDQKTQDSNVSFIKNKFNSIQFYDLLYSEEDSSEISKINMDEVNFIQALIKKFINLLAKHKHHSNQSGFSFQLMKNFNRQRQLPAESTEEHRNLRQQVMNELKGGIGIISPYKSQVRSLKDKVFGLLRRYVDLSNPQEYIEINTVDAFQGREKDIIIFSCVRSSKERQLGFVSDYRRMNVAITRAKSCLFVVGNSQTLNRDKNWRSLIQFCRDKQTKSGQLSYQEFKCKDDDIITNDKDDKDQGTHLKMPKIMISDGKKIVHSDRGDKRSHSKDMIDVGLSGLSTTSPTVSANRNKNQFKDPSVRPNKRNIIEQGCRPSNEKQKDGLDEIIHVREKFISKDIKEINQSSQAEEGQIESQPPKQSRQLSDKENLLDQALDQVIETDWSRLDPKSARPHDNENTSSSHYNGRDRKNSGNWSNKYHRNQQRSGFRNREKSQEGDQKPDDRLCRSRSINRGSRDRERSGDREGLKITYQQKRGNNNNFRDRPFNGDPSQDRQNKDYKRGEYNHRPRGGNYRDRDHDHPNYNRDGRRQFGNYRERSRSPIDEEGCNSNWGYKKRRDQKENYKRGGGQGAHRNNEGWGGARGWGKDEGWGNDDGWGLEQGRGREDGWGNNNYRGNRGGFRKNDFWRNERGEGRKWSDRDGDGRYDREREKGDRNAQQHTNQSHQGNQGNQTDQKSSNQGLQGDQHVSRSSPSSNHHGHQQKPYHHNSRHETPRDDRREHYRNHPKYLGKRRGDGQPATSNRL